MRDIGRSLLGKMHGIGILVQWRFHSHWMGTKLGIFPCIADPNLGLSVMELLKNTQIGNKVGIEQVWKFAHIKEGDRIIANKGTNECSA